MRDSVSRGALVGIAALLVAAAPLREGRASAPVAGDPGHATSPEARRRARLRTLLPIFRTVLRVVVLTVAVMMVLAALGVEIGPLIAGAGIVGLAFGSGSQALVRDIIAGMFYLIDDAFRIGEYIQSGNDKGAVESFSIRSVRLRHRAAQSTPYRSASWARCRT